MADPCIISIESLSQKEQSLKQRLFGTTGAVGPSFASVKQKTMTNTQQSWKQPTLYQEQCRTSSPQKVMAHHQAQLASVTDQNMNTFVDEMRQQFQQTSNASQIPLSLLYQQNRMAEKQTMLLENGQRQISEIMNNFMNQGATGSHSSMAMSQQLQNENRRMMLEMMAPMTQQYNELKQLYESNKSSSNDVKSKLDELTKVLTMQHQHLTMNSSMASQMGNPFAANLMGTGIMDPQIMKKGIEDIKEQMRDAQREMHLIESDAERRHKAMIQKNQQSRYLPQSLTEEFDTYKHQLKEQTVQNSLNQMLPISQTREAVIAKLGGPFDYGQFSEDLRLIIQDKELLERQFKTEQLWAPEFPDKAYGKIEYDFSIPQSIFSKDVIGGGNADKTQDDMKVSFKKPQHYSSIQTQPKYMLDCDINDIEVPQYKPQQKTSIISNNPKTLNQSKPTATQNNKTQSKTMTQQKFNKGTYKPKASDTSFSSDRSNKKSPASDQKSKGVGQKSSINDIKNKDILSLKKMVIEEIKSELYSTNGINHQPKDPNRDQEQKYKDSKNMDSLRIQGGKSSEQDENDLQSKILNDMQKVKLQNELEFERNSQALKDQDLMRASTNSLQNPLTETMIMNTIADMILKEMGSQQQVSSLDGIDQQDIHKFGEDLIIDKIKGIFDEVARDRQEFEESYVSNSQKRLNTDNTVRYKPDLVNTSIQVLEQSLQDFQYPSRTQQTQNQQQRSQSINQRTGIIGQIDEQAPQPYSQTQQPMIVPIVINQQNQQSASNNNSNGTSILQNPNQLRDLITQAISSQLQMHNIKAGKDGDLRGSISDSLNQTSRTMQEEEARLKVEQQLLRKQIPINVHPYIQQTINQGPSKMQSYQNPFFYPSANGQTAPSNLYGIQPPLLNDLDQFNLSSDSSSGFMSMNSSQYSGMDFFKSVHKNNRGRQTSKQGRYVHQDDRSEGEVGGEDSGHETSLGEIKFPITGASGKKQPRVGKSALGETIDYEEDKIPDDVTEKPIYESTEGPIPKAKGQIRGRRVQTGKSGANILLSGESFGMNPLRSGKGPLIADSKVFQRREKIDDNFLEEEEDYQSSRASESGEIDPSLFR